MSEYLPSFTQHWMAQAYELACLAGTRDEVPVGAILIANNEIIGMGMNVREQSTRTAAHAEIMALEDFSRRHNNWVVPKNCFLFSTSEPCLMCTGALLWARVENIFYGCSDPKNAGLERVLPLINLGVYDHRFKSVRSGILGDKCSQLLKRYFHKKRRSRSK